VAHQNYKQLFLSPWYWLVPVIGAVVLALIAISGINQTLFMFLNSVLNFNNESLWLNITLLGDAGITAVLVLPLLGRRTDIVWAAIIAGIITAVIVNVGKVYFAVPRPPAVLDLNSFNQLGNMFTVKSFPSGHTAAAFTVAAVVILSIKQLPVKIIILIAAILVGISRIAIGAHWPMDVLAGAIIGWLPSIIAVMLAQKKILHNRIAIIFPVVLLVSTVYYLVFVHQSGDIEARYLEIAIPIICLMLALPGFVKIIKNDTAKRN